MPAKFVLSKGRGGKFKFELLASNGKVIATSGSYDSKRAAAAGIRSVQKNGTTAVVDDQTEPAAKAPAKRTAASKTAAKQTTSRATKQTTARKSTAAQPTTTAGEATLVTEGASARTSVARKTVARKRVTRTAEPS